MMVVLRRRVIVNSIAHHSAYVHKPCHGVIGLRHDPLLMALDAVACVVDKNPLCRAPALRRNQALARVLHGTRIGLRPG